MRTLKNLLLILTLFGLVGCGYRPASYYVKNRLGNSIYAEVNVPIRSPEYAIAITDAVREAIVGQFKGRIAASKEDATSVIQIGSASYSVSGIQTDANGITILYRASVTLRATVYGDNISKRSFTVNGIYDFPMESDSTLSEQKKLDAVKEAAVKALEGLISQLAIRVI